MEKEKQEILDGKLKLNLIAGIHLKVAYSMNETVRAVELGRCIDGTVRVMYAPNLKKYFQLFNDCLAETDVLWTKPSELVFYAALGLPILLADPIGGQEHANREWLLSKNAGLDAGDPLHFNHRLESLLSNGELYRIARNGFSSIRRNGAENISRILAENRSEISLRADRKPGLSLGKDFGE